MELYLRFDNGDFGQSYAQESDGPPEGDNWYLAPENDQQILWELVEGKVSRVSEEAREKYFAEIQELQAYKEFRTQRNQALLMSDWTQLPDAGLSDEAVAEWRKHRQELRDLPTKVKYPEPFDWPQSPTIK